MRTYNTYQLEIGIKNATKSVEYFTRLVARGQTKFIKLIDHNMQRHLYLSHKLKNKKPSTFKYL